MKEKSPRNMPVLKTYYFWTFTLSFYILNNTLMVCYIKNPTSLAILHFHTNNIDYNKWLGELTQVVDVTVT